MDGTEYQKCPSKFFILLGYIDKVYVYLYMYSKFFTNILWGLKFDVKLESWDLIFKIKIGKCVFLKSC